MAATYAGSSSGSRPFFSGNLTFQLRICHSTFSVSRLPMLCPMNVSFLILSRLSLLITVPSGSSAANVAQPMVAKLALLVVSGFLLIPICFLFFFPLVLLMQWVRLVWPRSSIEEDDKRAFVRRYCPSRGTHRPRHGAAPRSRPGRQSQTRAVSSS